MSSPSETSPAATDVWTVQRILEWTAAFLKQKDVESPRLEAELLLAHARRCQRIKLYMDFDAPLTDGERTQMRDLVQRRAKRVPLAYLVGTREFYGQPFEVGPGILIPRPETETLVDACLERIPKDQPRRIIEVGVGSGCIAVTLARLRPLCRIVATDISSTALEFARRNAAQHGVADRVDLRVGSALEPILADGDAGELFDGLVSNPPYIRDDERIELQPEVVDHEPPEALFAGVDGLDVVRLIAADARRLLRPGAFLALELDPSQCAAVGALLLKSGFEATTLRRDLNGRERIVEAVRATEG